MFIMLERIAQKFAVSTSRTIGYDVFITNKDAIMIGASEIERLGSIHEPSLRVIANRQPNPECLTGLRGSKPGIALPIEIAGDVIGTVGITGAREKVEKFGMLIKKHVELTLQEQLLFNSALLSEQATKNLLQEILGCKPGDHSERVLISRGLQLGYDLTPPHITIVIDLLNFEKYTEKLYLKNKNQESVELNIQLFKRQVHTTIKNTFKPNDLVVSLFDDKFVIFKALEQRPGPQEAVSAVKNQCQQMLQKINNNQISANIGIGSIAKNIYDLRQSYRDAWKALELGKKIKNRKPIIVDIQELALEDLITAIDKDNCSNSTLGAIDALQKQQSWPELAETICKWCEAGFSMQKAADKLYIHRNTLQHRLNRITQITDIDRDDYKSYLACYLIIKMGTFQEIPDRWDAFS